MGAFRTTNRLLSGVFDENLSEGSSKEDELNPGLSDFQEGERFRVPDGHRSIVSSVPFKWEEAPGKARASCRDISMSKTKLQLQLPPRLQFSQSSEIRRSTDQTHSVGQKMRARQLKRRHTIVVDSRRRIGQMKGYLRSITLQPRSIRCVFARKDREVLVAAPAADFSGAISAADKLDSPPDSPETDIGSLSPSSSTSSWCPDLSPDGGGPGAETKLRRKQAMERFLKFLSSWGAVQKVRRKTTKDNHVEMWSPTLATYLYNTIREEAAVSEKADNTPALMYLYDTRQEEATESVKAENWAAFVSLKEEEDEDGDVSNGAGNTERETEGEASLRDVLSERDDSSSFYDDSLAPENDSVAVSRPRPKRVFALTTKIRLLIGRLQSPTSVPPKDISLKHVDDDEGGPVLLYHS